jgi:hypothetical protein
MPFPPFDGENPRLWLTQSEDYFDLYNVDPHMWIHVARMNFTGSAARWLQSIVTRLKFCSWSEFSQMLLERFGRDQHEHLIRQLFCIKQTTTIAAYIEQFSGLVDQLHAYQTTTDPLFYTMRFIDGLKDHIKSSLLFQRPSNLDTACALAQLQEEVSEPARWEPHKFSSTTTPMPLPSPLPLPRSPPAEEARPRHGNDKLNSLKAYWHARGLCDKCAEKWAPGHRCSPTVVQLHVLEEIWQLFDNASESPPVEPDTTPPEELLTISLSAMSKQSGQRTLQLPGECQGQLILILLDSGSSHFFVSTSRPHTLSGVSSLPTQVSVHVADGGIVTCT